MSCARQSGVYARKSKRLGFALEKSFRSLDSGHGRRFPFSFGESGQAIGRVQLKNLVGHWPWRLRRQMEQLFYEEPAVHLSNVRRGPLARWHQGAFTMDPT